MSRGLGDVYKRQVESAITYLRGIEATIGLTCTGIVNNTHLCGETTACLLYTSDAADDSLRVDLGGRRIIKKKFFQAEDGILD